MNINERFQQIINVLFSGNKRAFSMAIGVSPTVIENIVGKRQGSPSFDVTNKLINAIANIDAEWLLTGKGKMFKSNYDLVDNNVDIAAEDIPTYNSGFEFSKRAIPLFDLDNTVDLLSLSDNKNKQYKSGELYIPGILQCDGAVYVRGDNMVPIIKSGDIICYKIVRDINNIIWGEMYLLEIENGDESYITIKYIQISELGDEYIHLTSENPHHQPFDILKTNIKALALIKASIRYNSMR